MLLAVTGQCEADHCPNDHSAHGRAVSRRRRGDLDACPTGNGECRCLPGLQPERVSTEPVGSGDSRQYCAERRQQRASGVIEVVPMVVVAEQHRVDRPEVGRGNGRARQLP